MLKCLVLNKVNDHWEVVLHKWLRSQMLSLIPASRSSLRREADACVSTRLTGANQAPIVARGVSRSFRAHHIDAALGLESDGMFRSRARY